MIIIKIHVYEQTKQSKLYNAIETKTKKKHG